MVWWDRFVYARSTQGRKGIVIYGWIPRKQDAYKDFLLLEVWDDGDMNFDTSSAKHSLAIYKILNGGVGYGHQKCRRVEHYFSGKNILRMR